MALNIFATILAVGILWINMGKVSAFTDKDMYEAQFDRRIHDTVFAEVGAGRKDEVSAVVSVFLNRVDKEGYEKALKGSSAYNKQSPQYKKASLNKLNPLEKAVYLRNQKITEGLIRNANKRQPFYSFENVKTFGEPKWAKGLKYQDIGRQRFYYASSD